MIQYTKMQDIEYLKDNYDYLVGWGVGRDESLAGIIHPYIILII